MIFKTSLPEPLPRNGVDVRLRFKRLPEQSCVLRARLVTNGGNSVAVGEAYLYGRGRGSAATEQAHASFTIDGNAIAKSSGKPVLVVSVEALDGTPIDDPELEMIDREIHARR